MSTESPLERQLPGYRFGIVLVLLFATFVVMASGATGTWSRLVVVLLQAATLVASLLASRATKRTLRIASIVATTAVLGAIASAISDTSDVRGATYLLAALLVAIAPVAIARSLWKRKTIDIQTILGAICIYVFVGMLWAFVFQAMSVLGHKQLFAQTDKSTTADTLYFSFVTLTTVGYGDLTPVTGLGRSFAVLEALLGQIYLVTVVSVLVSRLGRARETMQN